MTAKMLGIRQHQFGVSDFRTLNGLALDLIPQFSIAPARLTCRAGVKQPGFIRLEKDQHKKMRPIYWCFLDAPSCQNHFFFLGACRTFASRFDFCPFSLLLRCQNTHAAQLRSVFAALHQEKIIKNRLEVSKSDRLLDVHTHLFSNFFC